MILSSNTRPTSQTAAPSVVALAEVRRQLETDRENASPEQRQLINSALKHIGIAMDALNKAQTRDGR